MRFLDKDLNTNQVTNIIEKGYDIGITTHHSSFEYSSHQLYTNALKASTCKKNIKHIVKLAAPHFEEQKFCGKTLKTKVESQLKILNIDRIDVLQWLVRSKPINDFDRLNTLSTQELEIEECLLDLKKSGVIKSIFSFPYSVPFANEIVKRNYIDGIIAYLNTKERDFKNFANSVPFIAIRPFLGGDLVDSKESAEQKIHDCLKYVDSNKTVISKIISINSIQHLNAFAHLH